MIMMFGIFLPTKAATVGMMVQPSIASALKQNVPNPGITPKQPAEQVTPITAGLETLMMFVVVPSGMKLI